MPHFVIMGSGRVGAMVARALEDSGHTVAVIDQDERAFQALRSSFAGTRITGHGFDRDVLRRAGIERAFAFASITSDDNSNILAARVARETFHVAHVVARISDPARAEFYQRLGVPTVAAVRWSADQIMRRLLPEQSILGDFQEASGRLQLGELSIHDDWAGLPLEAIEEAAGVRVAFITRFGEGLLPRASATYQKGDLVHAMMRIDDIDDVLRVVTRPPSAQIRDLARTALLDGQPLSGREETR